MNDIRLGIKNSSISVEDSCVVLIGDMLLVDANTLKKRCAMLKIETLCAHSEWTSIRVVLTPEKPNV